MKIPEGCIFCARTGAELICENELVKAFYDQYPVNRGHVLIAQDLSVGHLQAGPGFNPRPQFPPGVKVRLSHPWPSPLGGEGQGEGEILIAFSATSSKMQYTVWTAHAECVKLNSI